MGVRKLNPLFVDSTKFQGDSIPTQVELSGILLYPEEIVVMTIQDSVGTKQTVTLAEHEGNTCNGRVWLKHQQEITYRYDVQKRGQVLFSSRPQTIRASYAIMDAWNP